MSYWNKQNLEVLQQQSIQRLVSAELELMAARSILSKIERRIVCNYLWDICDVSIGSGICLVNLRGRGPIEVVVEAIRPIGQYNDHVEIVFRAFTTKGKPCKLTGTIAFADLNAFKKKAHSNKLWAVPERTYPQCSLIVSSLAAHEKPTATSRG